jgi:hypothetical protein
MDVAGNEASCHGCSEGRQENALFGVQLQLLSKALERQLD